MIIQENEFLKTYDEMSSLWEDAEATEPAPDSRYTFSDVLSKLVGVNASELRDVATKLKAGKAEGSSASNVDFDFEYWNGLRDLLWGKGYRRGQSENATWISRFRTFYLPYRAEKAIIDVFNNKNSNYFKIELNGDHDELFSDAAVQNKDECVDYNIIENVTIPADLGVTCVECKSLSSTTSTHGAKLVIRHTTFKSYKKKETQTIKCFLVGPKELLNVIYGKKLPNYVCALEPGRDIKTGYSVIPSTVKPLEITAEIPAGFEEKLKAIDEILDACDNGVAKAKHAIEKQKLSLETATDKLGSEVSDATIPDDLKDPIKELQTELTDFVNAVSNKYVPQ
jgi:hypothetical protein